MKDIGYKFSLVLVAAALVWVVAFIVPQSIPQPSSLEVAKSDDAKSVDPIEDESQVVHEPENTIVAIEGIQVKASGEDPIDFQIQGRPLDLKKEFEARQFKSEMYDSSYDTYSSIRGDFRVPEGLKEMVGFWVQVFGRYGKGYYLFHHKDTVEILYSVLDLRYIEEENPSQTDAQISALQNKALIEEKKRIQNFLLSVSKKLKTGELLLPDEQRLADQFARNPDILISQASDLEKIRIQTGFAHQFKRAIILSGQYMNEIEKIFREKNLPIELTRLPLIESAFNPKAYSSAKAAGIWQFIPTTGALYLKVDDIADERYDPIFSTYAAAAHLKNEYQLIKNWPLTINAYNTGPGRILKAMKDLGTDDIERVIREFKDPNYQFYSRNYYPEFLAAVHVYENQIQYFGRLNIMQPLKYEVYSPNQDVNLLELSKLAGLNQEDLIQLNPALNAQVLNGQKNLPAGYLVNVRPGQGAMMAQTETFMQNKTAKTQWYVAQEGDTLESIAKKFAYPVSWIEKLNGLWMRGPIEAGTFIELPNQEDVALNPDQQVVIQ